MGVIVTLATGLHAGEPKPETPIGLGAQEPAPAKSPDAGDGQLPAKPRIEDSSPVLIALRAYLKHPIEKRVPLEQQSFAHQALSKSESEAAQALLWADHKATILATRADEMNSRKLKIGELSMPFFYKIFGQKPKDGRSLYISMHGGGIKEANDRQWENQKRLYKPEEGVYLAPRGPTEGGSMWYEKHIDGFFDRLIENLIVFEDVNPNRVYIMGYSAGGDGVYQLAPRYADRLAAASMMAGHPNNVSMIGVRNIGFSIQLGEEDRAYNRSSEGKRYGEILDALQKEDPEGYSHFTKLYPGKGHWMDLEDACAVPWMAKFTRNPFPSRVLWQQYGSHHQRFYWLAVDATNTVDGSTVVARYSKEQNAITIDSAKRLRALTLRVNDVMLDLDQPVTVSFESKQLVRIKPERTLAVLAKSLAERGDPKNLFSAEIGVTLPIPPAEDKQTRSEVRPIVGRIEPESLILRKHQIEEI